MLLVGLMCWKFGQPMLNAYLIGVICIMPALVGTALGKRLGDRLNRKKLKALAFILLLISSLVALLVPLVHNGQ